METLFPLMLQILPSAYGGLVLYAILRKTVNWRTPDLLIIFGAGTYVGPVLLASLMFMSLKLSINPYSWIMLPLSITVICLAWGIGSFSEKIPTPSEHRITARCYGRNVQTYLPLIFFSVAWLTLILVWLFIETWNNPTIAWDAVWSWGLYANAQIISSFSESPSVIHTDVHPATVSMISSWSAYWASSLPQSSFIYASNAILYLGWVLISAGFLLKETNSANISIIGTLIIISSPMLESHIALGGYADLWLSTGLIAGFALILTSQYPPQMPKIILGLVVIASTTLVKSNGFMYAGLVIFSLLLAWLLSKQKLWIFVTLIIVTSVFLAWATSAGVTISFGPLRAAYSPELRLLQLGNRVSYLSNSTTMDAIYNLKYAWIQSASFGYAFSVSLALMPLALLYALKRNLQSVLALSITSIIFLVFFLAAQNSSEYFYTYSQIDNDTGLTRFSHTLYWLSIINLVLIFNLLITRDWLARKNY